MNTPVAISRGGYRWSGVEYMQCIRMYIQYYMYVCMCVGRTHKNAIRDPHHKLLRREQVSISKLDLVNTLQRTWVTPRVHNVEQTIPQFEYQLQTVKENEYVSSNHLSTQLSHVLYTQ